MGSKNKLKRFKENLSFNNLFQPTRSELLSNSFKYKGFWKDYFKNNNPIVLELGCGKGEYTCSLAEKYPKKNFIGIDIKGARIWSGAKYAVVNSIENACFIRTQIELIEFLFSENEISEIWITFPDPQIKIQRQKHRLTNINFLNKYKIFFSDEPAIKVYPSLTVSFLSVFSLKRIKYFFNVGSSSCMPPLSLNIIFDLFNK